MLDLNVTTIKLPPPNYKLNIFSNKELRFVGNKMTLSLWPFASHGQFAS